MPPKDRNAYNQLIKDFQDEFGQEEPMELDHLLLFQVRNELRILNSSGSEIPTVPKPVVTILGNKAGLINEEIPLSSTASIINDTIQNVQFQVNNVNFGAPKTTPPYTSVLIQPTKGIVGVRVIATGNQGGSSTSSTINIKIFDSKIVGNGAGVGGASLASNSTNYMLFDSKIPQGEATSMNIMLNGQLIGVFNYDSLSYANQDFAFYYAITDQMYTGKIGAVVEF